MFKIPRAQELIAVAAGLIGMIFDQIERDLAEDQDGVAAEPLVPDDLKVIDGIGPTFARRLNDAGIQTYAQLAALSPVELRTITKAAAWQGDPEAWIRQAKGLA